LSCAGDCCGADEEVSARWWIAGDRHGLVDVVPRGRYLIVDDGADAVCGGDADVGRLIDDR
jgi:hypothetical protein